MLVHAKPDKPSVHDPRFSVVRRNGLKVSWQTTPPSLDLRHDPPASVSVLWPTPDFAATAGPHRQTQAHRRTPSATQPAQVRPTLRISCEAVPASDLARAGMRRRLHTSHGAAESFVSFIRLLGNVTAAPQCGHICPTMRRALQLDPAQETAPPPAPGGLESWRPFRPTLHEARSRHAPHA